MDKKWNKWLIIGGILIPPLLFPPLGYLDKATYSSFGLVSWLIVSSLCIFAIWFGIFNYTKKSLGTRIFLSFAWSLVSIIILAVVLFAVFYTLFGVPI
jgi:hypothetical protein